MKINNGVIIICIATLISSLIANIPTGTDPGLGGLILWFWPPFLGILGLIIFLIISKLTRRKLIRIAVLLSLCIYLIYVGLGLYIDQGWPFIVW